MTKEEKLLKQKAKLDAELQALQKEKAMEKARKDEEERTKKWKEQQDEFNANRYWLRKKPSLRYMKAIADLSRTIDINTFLRRELPKYKVSKLMTYLDSLELD